MQTRRRAGLSAGGRTMPDESGPPPRRVLVVERDMIVGMSLAQDLAEFGYAVSGPFNSLDEVEPLLDGASADLAIVDVALRDGTGIATARAVKNRGIPLVLFSSGNRQHYVDGEFKDVPWVEKPASTEQVLRAFKPGGTSPR